MNKHDSMRGYFAYNLHKLMGEDKNIYLLMGDLGYGMFDALREDYPDRCINTGAAEQAMLDISVGLAMSGKTPIVYSITPFLLYRPFETMRTYINYEKIPVKLIGGGRNKDYEHDGMSHWSEDDKLFMGNFKNIESSWPETKDEISYNYVKELIYNEKPTYINLKR